MTRTALVEAEQTSWQMPQAVKVSGNRHPCTNPTRARSLSASATATFAVTKAWVRIGAAQQDLNVCAPAPPHLGSSSSKPYSCRFERCTRNRAPYSCLNWRKRSIHEIVFAITHDQHRTRRVADDPLGSAAEERVL